LRIADRGSRIDKSFNLDFAQSVGKTHKSAIRNPGGRFTAAFGANYNLAKPISFTVL
jgi:hypothetical protein